MENIDILQPLLEKGDLKQTLELASTDNKALADISSEGMNIVTASILADIPSVHKTALIQKTGALFSSGEYCKLLNTKLFTLPPDRRDRLKAQGIPITRENTLQYSEWFNIFDIAFPWLPLSIFEDFVTYLHDDKKLSLDKDTIETIKQNFASSKHYSERELDCFFDSSIFHEG